MRFRKAAHMTAAVLAASTMLSSVAYAAECTNERWNAVMERGTLIAGVKADYKPWGYRDTDGSIIGMEADMAADVAAKMGVDLELVAVVASNRMQFLEQGQIDLLIATMTDRPDRREIVGIVGPNYYTSGTNIMSPKALGLTEWSQLEGKPVCGVQAAFYNKIVEDRYGAEIVAFAGTAEAKQALRDRKCIAFLYDDSSIGSDLASGNWDDFEMPLASEDDSPWALAVPKSEQNCVFGNFMSGIQYNWHRDGALIALEQKWGIKPTAYLEAMSERMADHMADKN
ncbi:MAG: transporter substrate-binding domain-containing protein [Pseudomonadota bacterium]